MLVYKVFENNQTTVEEIGEFTVSEFNLFRKTATRLMQRMCEMNPNLVIVNGVWSVHLWDESKRTTVLTYSAEITDTTNKL